MSPSLPHGVLVVDKPSGPTSHDVVRAVRRALCIRRVGHAGTLDPAATGVLVIGVGEGTKLLAHLAAQDKRYAATLRLGSQTDTLDARGCVVGVAPVPQGLDVATVTRAARAFVGETSQRVPEVSAVKQGGLPLYQRVRRGEHVEPPVRTAIVHSLEVLAVRDGEIDLRVHCGKGYYVRALGRDLAAALGTLGHLAALRRTASGAFDLTDAVPWDVLAASAGGDAQAQARLRRAVLAPAQALRGVPRVTASADGVVDVRHGRPLVRERWQSEREPEDGAEPVAVVDGTGRLVAIGRVRAGRVEIVRGVFDEPDDRQPPRGSSSR